MSAGNGQAEADRQSREINQAMKAERNAKLLKFYAEGLTGPQMGARLRIADSTCWSILKRLGVKR